jgi:hypothetical protein
MNLDENTARKLAYACGQSRFERHGYDAKHSAQRNLSGRTHYADDDTLKFFHSRINSAWPECNGLILILIESVAADMRNTSRGFRFVAFDIFGTVIERADLETLHKDSGKARAAAETWLAGFDVAAHYRRAIAERADSLDRQARELRSGLAMLESVPA